MCSCTFGTAPTAILVETPEILATTPAATILDNEPLVNVPTFVMCESPANPEVAAATAAAMGVLTPMPCIPETVAPWIPGCETVLLGGIPALDEESELMCMWGGVITVDEPGQFTTEIP